MIKSIDLRVWKVLLKKPFRLWGISLLCVFLTGLGSSLTAAIPLIAICIAMLLDLGMRQVYLQGYREEEIQVETLFDGFRTGFGKKLAGYAWAELFVLLWGLIPIVGPIFATIRQYEYAFVPYILMERPDVAPLEARKISREETMGWKRLMFGADVLLGVLLLAAFLVLLLLSLIPVLGILFRLVLVVYTIACIAFMPLIYGLLRAAFYEEIKNGNLAAEAAAQASAAHARYAAQAGAASGAAATAFCPNCGSPVEPGARFCPSCGTPLTPLMTEVPPAPEAPESPAGPETPEEPENKDE